MNLEEGVIYLDSSDDECPPNYVDTTTTNWISRLPYEEEIMLDDFLDDVVFITARGLGMERLFLEHLYLYCDPAFTVFVLNTEAEDQHFFIEKLRNLAPETPPRIITSDVSVKNRELVYKTGGIQFITSRILMFDLLTNKVPISKVSGIMLYRAHRALQSYQETFILRLFRERKRDGFVKAFTDRPISISSGGLGQLQRLINRLYVRKVRILPRFDAGVRDDFEKSQPRLVDISVDLPPVNRQICVALVDIITTCVRELRQCTHGLQLEIKAEAVAVTAALRPTMMELELCKRTLLLTERQERLMNDLRILRNLLRSFEDLDPASVYKMLTFYKSNQNYVENNSGWLSTPTAAKVFSGVEKLCTNANSEGHLLVVPPPKWTALCTVLKEIRDDLRNNACTFNAKTPVIVLCSNESAIRQLIDVCKFGVNRMVWLQSHFYHSEVRIPFNALEPHLEPMWSDTNVACYDDQILEKDKKDLRTEVQRIQKRQIGAKAKRPQKRKTIDQHNPKQPKLVNFGLIRYTEKLNKAEKRPNKIELPTSSSSQESNPLGDAFYDEKNVSQPSSSQSVSLQNLPPLLFVATGNNYRLIDCLESLAPAHIILYQSDLTSFRLIEYYKAHRPEQPLTVYALTHVNSTEEERYLISMQAEQTAMESLIREQGTLMVPMEFDTARESTSKMREITLRTDFRINPNVGDAEDHLQPSVVTDVREFNSELPTVLYQSGIDLMPCTLEVGDYILSPTVCVERKALDDLAQSLNNGRVFKQVEQMSRHYKRAILLIESSEKFRHTRVNGGPFQGELSRRSSETRSLLCQLVRSNPRLSIFWSLSPAHSAEIFEEIKLDQPNPDPEKAASIRSDDLNLEDSFPDATHSTTANPRKSVKVNPLTRRALQTVPDINFTELDRALRLFRNLTEFVNASANCFSAGGFGTPFADNIFGMFNTDFRLVDA